MDKQVANAHLFGEIVWLLAQSSLHKSWSIEGVLKWVSPAMSLRQYRLYHRDGKPVGYVSWAKLSPEVESRFALHPRTLQPREWNSGDRWWLIDFVAPFGDAKTMIRDIRKTQFPEGQARALRLDKSGDGLRIAYFHGVDVSRNIKTFKRQPTVDIGQFILRQ